MFKSMMTMAMTASLGLSSLSLADELVPYVECRDQKNPELLISKSPDQGVYLYNASGYAGLASKLAFALRIGRTVETMTLKVAPSAKCRLVDNKQTFGIVGVNCDLSAGAELKITPADQAQMRIGIRSGKLSYYRNAFYGGQNKVTVDLVTIDGRHVSVIQDFDLQACKDDTISSPPH